MGIVLALDFGQRSIGLAVGERGQSLAFARPRIVRHTDEQVIEEISTLVKAENISEIVVGHPRSLSGKLSAQTLRAEDFAKQLRHTLSLPVHLVDERLSSVAARRTSPGAREHSEAARIILEQFLATP